MPGKSWVVPVSTQKGYGRVRPTIYVDAFDFRVGSNTYSLTWNRDRTQLTGTWTHYWSPVCDQPAVLRNENITFVRLTPAELAAPW